MFHKITLTLNIHYQIHQMDLALRVYNNLLHRQILISQTQKWFEPIKWFS